MQGKCGQLKPYTFVELPRTRPGRLTALVPALGTSSLIKQALGGHLVPGYLMVTVAASVIYAGLALVFCTWPFEKESVLLKG